jgi:hypothetical protein
MWNENGQGKLRYWKGICQSATLSTTYPTWADLGLNPDCRGRKPATSCLSSGMAHYLFVMPTVFNWKLGEQFIRVSFSIWKQELMTVCYTFVKLIKRMTVLGSLGTKVRTKLMTQRLKRWTHLFIYLFVKRNKWRTETDIIGIQISHIFYQIIKGILCSTVWFIHESYASASMLSRAICFSGLIEESCMCSCLCMHAILCLFMLKAVNCFEYCHKKKCQHPFN